jgi:putative transposase
MRNLLGRVPPSQRAMVAALLRTIFAQDTKDAAHEQWRRVADGLRERFPKVAELMDGAEHDVLAHRAFPKEHWPQLASTNPLERLNGEVKRRTDVVGIFPNAAAMTAPTMLPSWGSSGRWSWSADGFGRDTGRVSARSR